MVSAVQKKPKEDDYFFCSGQLAGEQFFISKMKIMIISHTVTVRIVEIMYVSAQCLAQVTT